jgi:hypothetical protein
MLTLLSQSEGASIAEMMQATGVAWHLKGDRKEVGGRSRKEEYRSRHSCWRRFSMKWTVKLERIDEAGNSHSTTVGYVERPELTSEAELGLTHDDGKCLIRRIQAEVAHDQVRALISKVRPCLDCGRLRSIKEHRRRRIDTVFGHLRIHAPRFEACVCGCSAASSPMAVLFPHRSTPELRYLQTKLGCKFSYQQAADILNEFLPDLPCFNHATTRNRVLAVGKAIEAETRAEIAEKPSVEKPVELMIVGIDGAFVKATRPKNQRKNFEIVLGRIEACGHQEKIFASVRDLDDLARERVRSALRSAPDVGQPPRSLFSLTERTP